MLLCRALKGQRSLDAFVTRKSEAKARAARTGDSDSDFADDSPRRERYAQMENVPPAKSPPVVSTAIARGAKRVRLGSSQSAMAATCARRPLCEGLVAEAGVLGQDESATAMQMPSRVSNSAPSKYGGEAILISDSEED